MEPDSKELAEHRIRQSLQNEMEKFWKDRMENKDQSTTKKVETLHSQVLRLSEEVVCMKNRHHGSAASTVAAFTGSGGGARNSAASVMQHTFVASRIELKGWGVWKDVRGSGITLDEGRELVVMVKILIQNTDMDKFDWDLTARNQRVSDIKIMTFLWFKGHSARSWNVFSWIFNRPWLGHQSTSKGRM